MIIRCQARTAMVDASEECALLAALDGEINRLTDKFAMPWIPADPDHNPEDFQHDVKAYCVLAHAAFEEFAEDYSVLVLQRAKKGFLVGELSRAVVGLLMAYPKDLQIVDDESQPQDELWDQTRKALDAAVSSHSKVVANSNGVGPKYLRRLLTPLAVRLPAEVRLNESLRELCTARGSYAHSRANLAGYGRHKKADKKMTPEEAKDIVADCLDFFRKLAASSDGGNSVEQKPSWTPRFPVRHKKRCRTVLRKPIRRAK